MVNENWLVQYALEFLAANIDLDVLEDFGQKVVDRKENGKRLQALARQATELAARYREKVLEDLDK